MYGIAVLTIIKPILDAMKDIVFLFLAYKSLHPLNVYINKNT